MKWDSKKLTWVQDRNYCHWGVNTVTTQGTTPFYWSCFQFSLSIKPEFLAQVLKVSCNRIWMTCNLFPLIRESFGFSSEENGRHIDLNVSATTCFYVAVIKRNSIHEQRVWIILQLRKTEGGTQRRRGKNCRSTMKQVPFACLRNRLGSSLQVLATE